MSEHTQPDSGSWMGNVHRCPRCHAHLLANSKHVWCSYVGCKYGLDEQITKEGYFTNRYALEDERTDAN